MVKVTVRNINFGEKEIELKKGTAEELIKKLETNDDAIIIVDEDGEILTKDRTIKDGSRVNVVEVFSGG
jgi:sulfur carrier protein ThiS